MAVMPKSLLDLIESFKNLPGVGPRSAERYAYFMFKQAPAKSKKLAQDLAALHESIKLCPQTFALIDKDEPVSKLYSDPNRDRHLVAVVAEPFDIPALESTGEFGGTYHVLGGLISPIDGIGPENLHIKELVERVKKDKVKEIIMAISASVEGESTALYIQKALSGLKVKITRLARGLPVGLELEYADQITLSRALEGRQAL